MIFLTIISAVAGGLCIIVYMHCKYAVVVKAKNANNNNNNNSGTSFKLSLSLIIKGTSGPRFPILVEDDSEGVLVV